MVVDTSALLAIAYSEAGHEDFERAIETDATRLLSAASALEAAIVMTSRAGAGNERRVLIELDRLIASLGLTLESVTPSQALLARDAYLHFGKGRHRAGLNFGDCFAYALAKESGEPLLFKGDDFLHTDIVPRA